MKNTVTVPSKKRNTLKLVIAILVLFFILMVIMLITFKNVGEMTLCGDTDEVTGVVSEVEDKTHITLSDGSEFNAAGGSELNWKEYIGKEVTLVTSPLQGTYSSDPWILGVIVNGETLVDAETTLKEKQEENRTGMLASGIVAGILAVAACLVIMWYVNSKPTEEKDLLPQYCDFLASRQPSNPMQKVQAIFCLVWAGLIIVLGIVAGCLSGDTEEIAEVSPVGIAFLIAFLAVFVIGIAGLIVLLVVGSRKEMEMYAEKFPFDFTDISHIAMKKSVKEKLQQEIIADKAAHPHTYGDGGNGYDVTFDEQGVTLTPPYYEDELPPEEAGDKTSYIFSDMPTETSEGFERMGAFDEPQAIRLSYERLNFEAVPHYRRGNRPLMVVIKSRIEDNSDLPEEFANDLHILLDSNLLKTLQAFNVPVENLQYILKNKLQLMKENCRGKRKKQK